MDSLKETIKQLIIDCNDIHQLHHIKLLLQSEIKATAFAEPNVEYGNATLKKVQAEVMLLLDTVYDVDFLEEIRDELDPNATDAMEKLSPEDRAELLELIDEPFDKDVISHEEFLKVMARWDTK